MPLSPTKDVRQFRTLKHGWNGIIATKVQSEIIRTGGAWLAQSVDPMTLDLGTAGSSPTLSGEREMT